MFCFMQCVYVVAFHIMRVLVSQSVVFVTFGIERCCCWVMISMFDVVVMRWLLICMMFVFM